MSEKCHGHRDRRAGSYTDFEIAVERRRILYFQAHPEKVYCWREVWNQVDELCPTCTCYNPEKCKNIG